MPYREILANNLIVFRKSLNISQAEMSYLTDVSKDTVSLIERCRANVNKALSEGEIKTGYERKF